MVKPFVDRLRSQGMPPKAAIAAAMHKIVRIAHGVLKSGNAFRAHYALDSQDGI